MSTSWYLKSSIMRRLWFSMLLLWQAVSLVAHQAERVQRPFLLHDLCSIADVADSSYGGPLAFSTHGSSMAFVTTRELTSGFPDPLKPYLRGEIWVQDSLASVAHSITDGWRDGTGWFMPRWSPDGKTLAMLSTRGSHAFNLWVMDMESQTLRLATKAGIALPVFGNYGAAYTWVSADKMLCMIESMHSDGSKCYDQPSVTAATAHLVADGWSKQMTGAVSASVLESGAPPKPVSVTQEQLGLIDLRTGEAYPLTAGKISVWRISFQGDRLAVGREQVIAGDIVRSAEVLDFSGSRRFSTENVFRDVNVISMRWSPDGSALAFVAHAPHDSGRTPLLARYDWSANKLTTAAAGMFSRITQVEWTAENELAFAASIDGKSAWWIWDKQGEITPIVNSEHAGEYPSQLWVQKTGHGLFGIVKDELVQINCALRKTERIFPSSDQCSIKIEWPATFNEPSERRQIASFDHGAEFDSIIISAKKNEQQTAEYVTVDLKAKTAIPISRPAAGARLAGYSVLDRTAVFYRSDRQGTFLWRTSSNNNSTTVLWSANRFVNEISEGEERVFDYTSLNGENLKGRILLPYAYDSKKRYPLITWVYPGQLALSSSRSAMHSILSNWFLNLKIAAARGYAVLIPTMPSNDGERAPSDPYAGLLNGVLPAVDKAVELGVADRQRLFVMGHSFGGFATYGLITQTTRFRAAVAHAGITNYLSIFGTFNGATRYTDAPQLAVYDGQVWAERSQGGMRSPPWKDLGRYVRNSPISYVEQVRTPVLLAHGDLDPACPIEQAEEFYRSLYRQAKRAQFVRYWGEGHGIVNLANLRDFWSRIFSWFDEFGDIARDDKGNLLWDGDHVKSRNGAPPLKPEDFERFDKQMLEEFAKAHPDSGTAQMLKASARN